MRDHLPLHETTLKDVLPPPNWLSYTPTDPKAEYVLDSTWGYNESPGSGAALTGEFFITDRVSGECVAHERVRFRRARQVRAEMVEEVRWLNRRAKEHTL
jgi:hypothetical protein